MNSIPPPFNRRDSTLGALSAAFAIAVLVWSAAVQATGWPAAALWATFLLSALATLLLLGWLLRRLPPDLDLRHPPPPPPREPPPDVARLRVALRPEPAGWYRLDILLDGVRVGQLHPGTAFVSPITAGRHELSARAWIRRIDLHDVINALPGTDSDFVIQGSGSKARHYAVERHGFQVILDTGTVTLVAPDP